ELPGDLEHHYIITIDLAQPPRLQYLHRDVRDPQRRWVCLGDFRGGLAILAAGVDMLERLRRQSARLEGERGRAQFPSAGIADWRDAHGAKIVV
ncbi:hypothetical protein, partial [Nocardia cyriacigeorgica]|uniref:hypothetical protein n=1 Tax=Nocardia cyriacigeorgica TaxID=135487 RepID=UPI001895C890